MNKIVSFWVVIILCFAIAGFTACGTVSKLIGASSSPAAGTGIDAWCLAAGASKPFVAAAITHRAITVAEFPIIDGARTLVNATCEATPRPTLSGAALATFKSSVALLVSYQPNPPPLPGQYPQ